MSFMQLINLSLWQSIHPFLTYGWSVTCPRKGQDHGQNKNLWLHIRHSVKSISSFSFHGSPTIFSWGIANWIFDLHNTAVSEYARNSCPFLYYVESWTQWLTLCRWHIQLHFLERKLHDNYSHTLFPLTCQHDAHSISCMMYIMNTICCNSFWPHLMTQKEDISENHQRTVEEHRLRGLMWAQCNNFFKEEILNSLEIQFKHGMYSKRTNLVVWLSISSHSIHWCVIIYAGPSYLVMAHLIVCLLYIITCISTWCLHDMERLSSMLAFC